VKLYNTIVIFDVYTVAESNEAAREALLAWIAEGMQPSESVAVEVNREQAIRASWREQKPLVGADISDEDFKKLEGRTTLQAFEQLYLKRG
jgi:hypothetical protein